MQIIADVKKISKTGQHKLIFILNVLCKSSIHFTHFQYFFAKKIIRIFKQYGFYRKWGCLTMRNYAETCKVICSYNIVYNFLI